MPGSRKTVPLRSQSTSCVWFGIVYLGAFMAAGVYFVGGKVAGMAESAWNDHSVLLACAVVPVVFLCVVMPVLGIATHATELVRRHREQAKSPSPETR